jgi:hypothetical protein
MVYYYFQIVDEEMEISSCSPRLNIVNDPDAI